MIAKHKLMKEGRNNPALRTNNKLLLWETCMKEQELDVSCNALFQDIYLFSTHHNLNKMSAVTLFFTNSKLLCKHNHITETYNEER